MTDENRFPLSKLHKPKVERVVQFIRDRLQGMGAGELRAAASVLFALERLPYVSRGIQVSFGFREPKRDGNYSWVDIKISESEFVLLTGEHFYDPEIGGDTETRIAFEAYAGGSSCSGDIEDWLDAADAIVAKRLVTAEDFSDDDSVDWFVDDEISWDEDPCRQDASRSVPLNGDDQDAQRDQLRRIFEEASGPMKEPIRDQLAYRHMIALADTFEGWALDARVTPEQSAKLIGQAESLRTLADDVGPDWDPPPPDRLTLLGFLGRKALNE